MIIPSIPRHQRSASAVPVSAGYRRSESGAFRVPAARRAQEQRQGRLMAVRLPSAASTDLLRSLMHATAPRTLYLT